MTLKSNPGGFSNDDLTPTKMIIIILCAFIVAEDIKLFKC